MFRRIRGWLVAGVATALVLTGCSAGGSAPAPAETAFNKDTAAEITFSWWGNEDRAKRFEQVIGMFNEEYPNVKVVRNFNSWGDYWTARNTEAAGRALPDAVMMDASYLGEYANKGLLKDLGPFRQNTLTLEGVSDSVLGSGTIGDKLVAVPLGTNAYSMMYNKKVLDAYGIEYPTSDMDWNQLNAFLMKVNQAGAGADPRIYGAEDYTGGFPGFIYHLMQSGNEVFTADGKPTFTEADVVSYLDSTASMRDAGDFYPIARSIALSPKGGFLDCYLAGVSTRRMDKLVKTLGINSLSKSQVSRMAESLDEHVEQFRHRPLDEAGPFTFVSADALTMKVREGGRVINAVVLLATGVNGDGHREVLGMRIATSETGAAWNGFFADLVARGLAGVRLVTSDAHAGLVEAIAAHLPGAAWQRCRTHYAANLMAVTPKSMWPAVKAMLPARRPCGSTSPPPSSRR
jgi:hypothetical protein